MIGFLSIFILKLKEIQFIIKSSLQKEIVKFFVKYDVLSQEETDVVFSVVFYMCYDLPNPEETFVSPSLHIILSPGKNNFFQSNL